MASTIDTSDGKIILNGGAVALPTSATTILSPASGSLRYNSTTDTVESYSATGAWYPHTSLALFSGKLSLSTSTTLTQANIGQFILCTNSSPITLTLPAINTIRPYTGFTIVAEISEVTLQTSGGNLITSTGSTKVLVNGQHASDINDGVNSWYGVASYNPNASVVPYVFESVNDAVSAAGTTQGTAKLIAAKYNNVTTVASGAGVILPALYALYGTGVEIVIWNAGANAVLIYPPSGCAINFLSTNAGYSLAVNASVRLVMLSATSWLTF